MECRINDLVIHYEIEGTGKPLLMLHGWPLDYRCLYGCMEPIFKNRGGWQRIYLDLPGMGQTKSVDWITSHDQILDVVLSFVEHIIPNQSFAIAGISYGGYLAQGLVSKTPRSIDGVAFIVSSVHVNRFTVPEKLTVVSNPALMARIDSDQVAGFEYVSVVQSDTVHRRWFDELEQGYRLRDEVFLSRFSDFLFSFEPTPLSEPFQKPALIICGRQDHFVGYRDQWDILESYPRASFVVLDRGGHMLYIEQETLFSSLLNEWLDRVEESLGGNRLN